MKEGRRIPDEENSAQARKPSSIYTKKKKKENQSARRALRVKGKETPAKY